MCHIGNHGTHSGNPFGKRSNQPRVLCQKCCNDTHVCNAELSCDAVLTGIRIENQLKVINK